MTDFTPAQTLADYALCLGDDALLLAQRLGAWLTRLPTLEEEVALANIALDLLGQARLLLAHAGSFSGHDEDALAYRRSPEAYRCVHLVEQPNGDFAFTIARQFLFSAYQYDLYSALQQSADPVLAAIAAKAIKEVWYHRDHCEQWVHRLGGGTTESNTRVQQGLDAAWQFVDELFTPDATTSAAISAHVGVDPSTLRPSWDAYLLPVIRACGLNVPRVPNAPGGGRRGVRSEHFEALHVEMTELHLAHPGAFW